jgi:hypothetical protein
MIRLFQKAADRGVKIVVPTDFSCAKKPTMVSKNMAGEESQKPSARGTEREMTGGKTAPEGGIEVTSGSLAQSLEVNSIDELALNNPDMHWTDLVMQQSERVRIVDLEDRIEAALAKVQNDYLLKQQ